MPKKIIAGRKYDTQTATLIKTKWSDLPQTDDEEVQNGKYRETLYLKQNGQYFLYMANTATNEWAIKPLRNKKKAMDWCFQNFDADTCEQIWGSFPE